MNGMAPTTRPDWVSDELYPFESRFFAAPPDHRMHYIDEGAGEPLVFVHGNPTWSFEFRRPVRELRSEFRCVAPDHIGFGLSSRSARREDHHPESHARRFAALLDHLGLRDVTLFLTDWGGPIGLNFARRHPDRVRRLVIANSWCWPVGNDFHFKSFSFLMSSWVGRYLIRHRHVLNMVMPKAVGDRSILTPEAMTLPQRAALARRARSQCRTAGYSPVRATGSARYGTTARPLRTSRRSCSPVRDIAFRRKELER